MFFNKREKNHLFMRDMNWPYTVCTGRVFEFSFGGLSPDGASRTDFLEMSLSLREIGGWGLRFALERGGEGSKVRRARRGESE